MDKLMKLPREMQVILGGSLLYLIFSFFNWQLVSAGPFKFGWSEWHGIGVVAGLLVVALLLWEAGRLMGIKLELGAVSPGLVSVSLALLLLLFTLITFFDHSTARHWPAWIGFILSIAIAAAALKRAKDEGVKMPTARPTA